MLAMASSFRSPASSTSPREGRVRSSKWSGHCSSIFKQPLEIVLVAVRLVDDQLALFLAGGVGGSGTPARPSIGSAGRSGSSSCNSSTGLASISCSIRSSRARMGSCRISIDWIIRGASTCFCTNRRSCPRESRISWKEIRS